MNWISDRTLYAFWAVCAAASAGMFLATGADEPRGASNIETTRVQLRAQPALRLPPDARDIHPPDRVLPGQFPLPSQAPQPRTGASRTESSPTKPSPAGVDSLDAARLPSIFAPPSQPGTTTTAPSLLSLPDAAEPVAQHLVGPSEEEPEGDTGGEESDLGIALLAPPATPAMSPRQDQPGQEEKQVEPPAFPPILASPSEWAPGDPYPGEESDGQSQAFSREPADQQRRPEPAPAAPCDDGLNAFQQPFRQPPTQYAPLPAPANAQPYAPSLVAPLTTLPVSEHQPLNDANFEPWWQQRVTLALDERSAAEVVDPHELLLAAMRHSPRVEAVQALPAATQAQIVEAEAAFDLSTFLEASFLRVNDPVGNLLTTGGPPRLQENNGRWRGGVRKQTRSGAGVEISQGAQLQNSNSIFFLPQDQGLSRMAVSISQPLLRGAGREYNERRIVLASIRNEAAWQEYSIQIQQQLAAVSRAYWDLYLRRCVLAQNRRHLERAQEVLELLTQRSNFDAAGNQLARARTAVAARQVEITRALRDVRNAETEVRRLVQDPRLLQCGAAELVTAISPSRNPASTDIALSIATSLQNRPEVALKLRELRAACLQHNVSRKELLPSLNLVFAGYLSGLQGNSSVGDAWLDQFRVGGPTYGAGIVYEAPWGRRAARARVEKAQADIARINGELRAVLADVAAEVETAVHNVAAAHLTMQGRREAMQAAEADIVSLQQQWEMNPASGRLASALLDELLDAQQRLLEQERAFAAAENEYVVAQVALLRAEGRLMSVLPQN